MGFDSIYQFFQSPQPHHLTREQAACYVLSVLIDHDSYGTALIDHLAAEYPGYRLSDTILYTAVRFLAEESLVESYRQRMAGRGRPRHMYHIPPAAQAKAQELADLWLNSVQRKSV
jgi:DNA-binding PadR family transcriptional regulator